MKKKLFFGKLSEKKMNRSRVYVGGLPYGVRERDLERFFKGYGRTREIFIKNGYAFVEFENYRDADDAVYELNGKKLLGERVRVEPTRGLPRSNRRYDGDRYEGRGRGGGGGRYGNDNRSSSRYYGPAFSTEFRVIVKNLSSRVDWKDLKDYMRQVGEVTYADAHKQRRNEGIVEFASVSDMKKAIEKLDDTELSGRRIQLIEDYHGGRSGDRRPRSRSRSSSRSKSRSRSNQRGGNRSKSKSPAGKKKKFCLISSSVWMGFCCCCLLFIHIYENQICLIDLDLLFANNFFLLSFLLFSNCSS